MAADFFLDADSMDGYVSSNRNTFLEVDKTHLIKQAKLSIYTGISIEII